jgi:hypothetical protein
MVEQGTEYGTFIQDELKHEYDRRDSVNSRAATAMTAASGLVTLVLAVVAIAKGKDYTLSGGGLTALVVALIALLSSAGFGVLAGINWRYKVTSIATMQNMLGSHWMDTEIAARNSAAQCNVVTINSLRKGTNIKFGFLLAAALGQLTAIIALTVTAFMVVR